VSSAFKWGILAVASAAILGFGLLSSPGGPSPASGCGSTRSIASPDSVASLEFVELGGMPQWILVRGQDRSNPVLLWLHGGPGTAEMPIVPRLLGRLEERFVVVHWDQRGAGKSNPRDFDESTMTFERFLRDAHELTQALKARFGADSIYLVGTSWGTQLGAHLVHRWPEDYTAYVAVGQVVNSTRAERLGRDWLLERAVETGNPSEIRRIETLGPAPYLDHGAYVRYAKTIESYGGGMDLSILRLLPIALLAPEYCVADYIAWFNGSSRGSGPMWDEVHPNDLFADVPRLDVPVFFLSGERDMNTPVELVLEYFDALDAPRGKRLIVFDDAAHTPHLSQPDAFCDVLLEILDEVSP